MNNPYPELLEDEASGIKVIETKHIIWNDAITSVGEWLVSKYIDAINNKAYDAANIIFTLITEYDELNSTHLKEDAVHKLGVDLLPIDNTTPVGEQVKEVFKTLDEQRGYRPPKRNAEAASIQRMVKKGYNSKQIIECWQTLKKDKFWQDKELFLMTVESQIGAMATKLNNKPKADPDKYVKGKYGHMVQR